MQFAVDPSLPSSPPSSLQIVNKGNRCQMKLDKQTDSGKKYNHLSKIQWEVFEGF